MWVSPNHPQHAKLTGQSRPTESAAAPQETGERLATLPRSDRDGNESEVRVSLDSFNGNAYVSMRIWTKDRMQGAWWPSKKGLSVRLSEIDDIRDALAAAQRPAGARRADAPARGRRAGTKSQPSGPTRDAGTAAGGFDEFEGG